jgi:hypothetical protein
MLRTLTIGALTALLAGSAASEPLPGLQNPEFMRRPSANDQVPLYPRRAVTRGIPGAAEIECIVGPKGEMKDCQVLTEAPAGLGFGEATIGAARYFRVPPTDAAGQPTVGKVVRLPLRWNLPLENKTAPSLQNRPGRPAVLLRPSKVGDLPCPAIDAPQRRCTREPMGWDAFPPISATRAQIRTIAEGEAPSTLTCRLTAALKLEACLPSSTASPGAASAMLALAPHFVANDVANGPSRVGHMVAMAFDWPAIRQDVMKSRE